MGVGLQGCHAALSFNIDVPHAFQVKIAALLIALGRKCSKAKRVDIINGTSNMLPVTLSLKGKAGWDSNLSQGTYSPDESDGHVAEVLKGDEAVSMHDKHGVQMFIIRCPACNKDSPSHSYKLQRKDLDVKIKCIECSRCHPLRNWKCNCGVHWHVCSKHVSEEAVYPQTAASRPRTIARKASSKKRLYNASFEQILDDDLSKEAKRARLRCLKDDDQVISFDALPAVGNLRASMLSPKLRERLSSTLGSA